MKKMMAMLLTAALCLPMLLPAAGAAAAELQALVCCPDWTPNTNHPGVYAAQALG